MENRTFYNEILTEHNIHPMPTTKMIEPQKSLRGVTPSCGDEITLQLERPLSVKYIDNETFDMLKTASTIEKSYEEKNQQDFLSEF